MWRHGDVAWAIFETILMAFLGTMTAALVALPLGFLAARNFMPLGPFRFAVRRVFDFVRGVDGLIWTIILSPRLRPGPDDRRHRHRSSPIPAASARPSRRRWKTSTKSRSKASGPPARTPLQRARFGVIPQITPVLLCQVLYYLESNTRSATVIGAIVGGGIGLLADPGDPDPEGLGRGRLLHGPDRPDGHGDGQPLRLAAPQADQGGMTVTAVTSGPGTASFSSTPRRAGAIGDGQRPPTAMQAPAPCVRSPGTAAPMRACRLRSSS